MARYRRSLRRSFYGSSSSSSSSNSSTPNEPKQVIYRHHKSIHDYSHQQVTQQNRARWENGGGLTDRTDKLAGYRRAEAFSICESGKWEKGVQRMERELDGFDVPVARSIKRKGVWADQGDSLDIHRVYNGQLDTAWRKTKRRQLPATRQIVISFPLFIPWAYDNDILFWCGAAALKLADLLTGAGYSVTIVGVYCCRNETTGSTSWESLMVKTPEQPLDVSALMVAMGFTGFSRTVGFRSLGAIPFLIPHAFGCGPYEPMEPITDLGYLPEEVIRGLFDTVRTKETARQWIQDQLTRLEQKGEL